ncbi:MAG TPA: hypothetical protein VLX68_10535 [Chitinivibrionales bacterium]|nr:hypothetical protein [Chitinivibrionales bacterium]
MSRRFRFCFILLAAGVLLLAACAPRHVHRHVKPRVPVQQVDFQSEIRAIEHNEKQYGTTNRLLYFWDLGSLFHYAEQFDSSTAYLLKASDVYDGLFARSVTNEAASFLTNDNVRPYRSRPFELVLLHQFLAMNYAAAGNVDDALVETRRMQLLFNEWERTGAHDGKYVSDGMFHYVSSMLYDAKEQTDDAMISLYNAVKAFQTGPVPLPERVKDYACGMLTKNNRATDIDQLKIAVDTSRGKSPDTINGQSEIILVGYAGKGPGLKEEMWWGTYVIDGLLVLYHTAANGHKDMLTLPAPPLPEGENAKSGATFHLKFTLPQIKTFASQTCYFTVKGDFLLSPVQAEIVNDLDAQMQKSLDDSRKETITRTVIRVALRTIAAQTAKEKLQASLPVANLLLNAGTDALTDQLEKADTRSCFLLPKTIQIARVPVNPGVYSLAVEARDRSGSVISTRQYADLKVQPGQKKFIFCSSFQ